MNSVTDIAQRTFWKRVGLAGFAFFLAKGLAWLATPVVLYLLGAAGS